MKKTPPELDRIVDVVLAYKPKPSRIARKIALRGAEEGEGHGLTLRRSTLKDQCVIIARADAKECVKLLEEVLDFIKCYPEFRQRDEQMKEIRLVLRKLHAASSRGRLAWGDVPSRVRPNRLRVPKKRSGAKARATA